MFKEPKQPQTHTHTHAHVTVTRFVSNNILDIILNIKQPRSDIVTSEVRNSCHFPLLRKIVRLFTKIG